MHADDETPHDPAHFIQVYAEAQQAVRAYHAGRRSQVDRILESSTCDLCLGQALVGVIVRLASEHDAAYAVGATLIANLDDIFEGELG